jgi:hypothetical protein
MEPITRKQAQEQGRQFYFTGKPCKRGHLDWRHTSTHQCAPCKRLWHHDDYASRNPLEHRLRPNFQLSCAQCKQEIVLEGAANGYVGSSFCKIADSYKERSYCSKACADRHYSRRSDLAGRKRRRYNADSLYRKKLLYAQQLVRQSTAYKERQSKYHRTWRGLNKKARASYQLKWERHRRATYLEHRLKGCLRHRICEAVKRGLKSAATAELVGCAVGELRAHLEAQFQPGMTWGNWTKDGWHIDHIRPCASFDLTDPEQQRQCFHFTNLQPLWASDNCSKGAKW